MPDYGTNKKQICFESTDKLHADLKIRLHYDEIKIKEFFNKMVKAYINKDENITAFIEKLKEQKSISKTKRQKVKLMNKKEKETINKFALNKNEIENIFDILEKEADL